jgi:very-short-patch-repair endonuclease
MTGTHKRLSDALRGQEMPHRNEVRICASNWAYAYVADIYIPQRRIVIEVDGHSRIGREWRERVRNAKFRRDLGIRTIRIKNSEAQTDEGQVARKFDRLLRYR